MAINQAPKSVLIFSTAYLPMIGGAEIAVKEITQRLADWQFDMITAKIKPDLARFEKIGNINVYRIGFGINFDKFLLPLLGFFKAVKLDKKNKYSIIWSIMASQAGTAAAFLKIFQPNKKLLLTLQEGDLEEHLKRYVLGIEFLYKPLVRPWHLLPFKRTDYLTTISNDLKKRAQRNKVKTSIEVIPNGVDVKRFKPGFNPLRLKRELGIKQDEKVIVTVSRLVKKNGIDDLIRAGRYLNFPFKILVIGSGPGEKKLRKLAVKLEIEDKILFLGSVEHINLREYISLGHVFVRPSLSEGLGNVFLEAMATGVPVIGTPVGGIPDFLKDRKTGLFCQVRNSRSIAEKIKEILENDPLRKTLVKNGLKLVWGKYSWDKIALQMERIFLKLINEK